VTKQRGASSVLFARMKTSETQRECAEIAAYLDRGVAPASTPPTRYGPGIDLPRVMYLPRPGPASDTVDLPGYGWHGPVVPMCGNGSTSVLYVYSRMY
jgi:hypothetical protein